MTLALDGAQTPAPVSPVGRPWRDGGYELLMTACLLFIVVTVTRWVIGPSSISRGIGDIHAELGIIGAVVGACLTGLILSPLGRASGGHLNPSITLAMWRYGVFPGRAVFLYVPAQLIGSILGVAVARGVWGGVVTRVPVHDAALGPGPGWSSGGVFVVEAVVMAGLVAAVGALLSHRRLTRLTPFVVGLVVGGGIAGLGTLTGGSENPARQFGPAVLSGQTQLLWVYLLAPSLGALLAATLYRRVQRRLRPLTSALCGERDPPSLSTSPER